MSKKTISNDEKPKAKRGRPKNSVTQKKPIFKESTFSKKSDQEEEIILHVPLKENTSSDESDTNMFEVETETEVHNKAKHNPFLGILDSDTEMYTTTHKKESITVRKLNEKIKEKDDIIKKLEEKLSNSGYNDSVTQKTQYSDVIMIDNKTDKKIDIKKTQHACWWCSYDFTTFPCFLVESCQNNTYMVFGNFCSVGCGLKYNQKMINDYKTSQRSALTKSFYSRILGENNNFIPAQDKEILEKFGGTCTISDFRKKSHIIEKFKINIPPCIQVSVINYTP